MSKAEMANRSITTSSGRGLDALITNLDQGGFSGNTEDMRSWWHVAVHIEMLIGQQKRWDSKQ